MNRYLFIIILAGVPLLARQGGPEASGKQRCRETCAKASDSTSNKV